MLYFPQQLVTNIVGLPFGLCSQSACLPVGELEIVLEMPLGSIIKKKEFEILSIPP